MIKVLGIKIIDRIKEAGLTQGILSSHSDLITTRLGFHEVTDEVCSREAYIIVHLNDAGNRSEKMKAELKALGGIEIREMIFSNDKEPSTDHLPEGNLEVLGILLERDKSTVHSVQQILTSYGCNIRTRMGVNEQFYGQPAGLIILELKGDNKQRLLLEKDLRSLSKVRVRTMVF
jgi:hypothetical protein